MVYFETYCILTMVHLKNNDIHVSTKTKLLIAQQHIHPIETTWSPN